ncbi:MAG: DUF3553 domain-containing protein [Planctomycetota bacterium]|nr:DUF3553 domain-containing protein [Planctomycetota bacterium]
MSLWLCDAPIMGAPTSDRQSVSDGAIDQEKSMSNLRFEFGDAVRLPKRPEWGIGTVVKVQDVAVDGEMTQRVNARFPNGGLKTFNTAVAGLEIVRDNGKAPLDDAEESFADLHRMSQTDWLAPIAKKKIDEAMLNIPLAARDVFRSLESRLSATIDLYRFDRSGRGLMDWAVAQSALEDPLSRFSRHELEQYFDRWATEREHHLRKLLKEAASSPEMVRKHLDQAPAGVRQTMQRLVAVR